MKATDNKTLWSKIGVIKELCLMAKSVLIFGSECFLQFVDLCTGTESTLTLNSHNKNGDALKCFQGHSSLYIFAYAENCQESYIYVKTYPDFQLIAKFDGEKAGYKCLTFSESSMLFSLGEMPLYTITAWNWRSMDKFAENANDLLYENQMIKCSYGKPMFLAQLGIGSNKLFIWDVFTVCKKTIFAKHQVKMGQLKPKPFECVVWSCDTISLYIIDSAGNVYTVDRDFYLELVIETIDAETIGPVIPSICWFQHGLTVSGPNKEVRHYKKIGSIWMCESKFDNEGICNIISDNKQDMCFGHTETSDIVSFGTDAESIKFIRKDDSNFQDICLINPLGDFVVVRRGDFDLNLYDIASGKKISSLTMNDEIVSTTENPFYPFIATGHKLGTLKLVSFYNEKKPFVLVSLYLGDFPLSTTRFFEHGHIFVTGNLVRGEFFILKGLPGTKLEVLTRLEVGRQLADFTLVSSQKMMRFFAIPITHTKFYAGNMILRYCLVDNQVVSEKKFKFVDNAALYRRIYAIKGSERDRKFYIVPFNSRYFEIGETKRGSPIITIANTIKTGHQMRSFLLKFTPNHVVSWGYDGFTFVRSLDFQEILNMTVSHHRNFQGVLKALATPDGQLVVTLGYSGVLAASAIERPINETLRKHLEEEFSSSRMALMFKRATLGFEVEDRFSGKCWTEIERLKRIEEEERLCNEERAKILEEFTHIQKVVQELVDENFEAPDNKKLDLLEFYLDVPEYHRKQLKNKDECKEVESYLKSLIVAQDKVSEYIIKNYYEPMDVKWENIIGIFSAVKATNYCLLPDTELDIQRLQWIEEQRKVEQYLSSQDTFEPWQTMSPEELQELRSQRPVAPKDEFTGLINIQHFHEENEPMDPEKTIETNIAIAGSVSSLYIDVSPGHYNQTQLNTFYQCHLQQAVAEREVFKLKQTYNKCFRNTRAIKEREMANIKEKNIRLRHIISEFNYFSDKKVNIEILDPQWQPIENVESDILRVKNNEVPITPYISPSEQAILDARTAEEERLRLLLLADDFRERALIAMMNGVLEVRWEDELRKEVPKPKCMFEKQPEEYNEEDLRALKDYDEKVVQLNTDREKYKSLLEVEFIKLSVNLRETIRKFNLKLYDCTKYKFHIDSGMNQENLNVNRQRVIQNGRIELEEKELQTSQTIREYEQAIEVNQNTIHQIEDVLIICRGNIESMQLKEKLLEKAYRKDFQDMSPVVQEQAYKLYKKRPKAGLKAINTATVLSELAKGIMTNEITFAMTDECLEYLKSLENLDSFQGLPPTIDEHTWRLICKHRRLRIEYEIRVRAGQIQILEAEAAINIFQKRVVTQKEKILILNTVLNKTRKDRLHLIHNKQVQLVLRRGLVEIPLNGDLFTDFADAILVPKSEIEYVNKLIFNAGQLKLKTIEKNLNFRRKMMAAEWEHMELRMKINDFIEQKKDIEKVKFTKEMQVYLKNKNLGRKAEVESYEMEIELLAVAYENRITDKKEKVKKINKQLRTFKESNKQLDQTIKEVNIDLCYYKMEKDYDVEEKEKNMLQARLKGMLQRNELVQLMQKNHNEILVLQAELELLRLRTFPTFKYRILDD
ncbi:hypothetical protein ABEB36_006732 [Hypothenemus hampei]|uniref:Cilia- and flagella-associated protein 43 n=1 Tax=Hypothenemus hampei TaxID=57062 RepID=A0ABD1ERI9_HYPHA